MKYLQACKFILIFIEVLCLLGWVIVQAGTTSKTTSTLLSTSSAPVPRSKHNKRNGLFGGIMQNSFINRIAREVKISFSSELESLILQVCMHILACMVSYFVVFMICNM
ncbi:hypothetical protein EON65_43225 [archaeon]|nr:MAG: hypothetical protein EON65_43225 [archaeon]